MLIKLPLLQRTAPVAVDAIQMCLACLILVAGWLLTGASTALAQTGPAVANLGDRPAYVALASQALHWVDESAAADLQQVQDIPGADWQGNDAGTINFGQSIFPHWFHVRVSGVAQVQEPTYLRVDYAHLDQLDVYLLRDGQILEQHHTGDTLPFASRPVPHRTYLFPLKAAHGDSFDIYLRVATAGPMQMPLDILTRTELDRQDKQAYLQYGIYFGIMLLMLIYNGIIFLFVRDISYAFYILYIAATACLQFTLHGLSFQYVWPHSTILNNHMILIFTGLMPFTAIAFVWRFIGLGRIGTRMERFGCLALCCGFSAVLIGTFVMPYMTVLKLAHTLSFLSVSMGFYLGLKYWIKGIKSARIFAIAWFSYMVFILYYLLDIKGVIQPDIVSRHALEIGSLLELVLLSLAFADRINEEKDLRLKAQLKLNQDLDLLVRARTDELEQANQKLKEVSITDGLTGLYNRRHFDDVFASEFQRAYREKKPLALLMIDVDHFKPINDTHGHPFGDLCLQQVASIIMRSIRRPPDLAARYGGEEFVVLLPNTDLEGALCVAEAIRANLEATPVSDAAHCIRLTASLGAGAEIPASRDDPERLLRQVDQCLYQAKHNGRNRIESHHPTMATVRSA